MCWRCFIVYRNHLLQTPNRQGKFTFSCRLKHSELSLPEESGVKIKALGNGEKPNSSASHAWSISPDQFRMWWTKDFQRFTWRIQNVTSLRIDYRYVGNVTEFIRNVRKVGVVLNSSKLNKLPRHTQQCSSFRTTLFLDRLSECNIKSACESSSDVSFNAGVKCEA